MTSHQSARPSIDPRRLCQIEIRATDLDRARRFYRDAFGWDESPTEIHGVALVEVPRDCPFGMSIIQDSTSFASGSPVVYFAVESPEAIAEAAKGAGGRVVSGPDRQPGYGKTWRVADPDGNVWGLFQKR